MNNANKNKILVVDDSSSNRLLLSFMLQELGYQVDEAENGEVAVEHALEFDYVAIFMDINMPVMNGKEATEILRNLSFESPIFACTAEENIEKINNLLRSGFSGFISKPIEPEDINRILEQHTIQQEPEQVIDNEAYQQKIGLLSNRFTENIPVIVTKIEKALSDHSVSDLKRVAHKLKGTASQFGFEKIAKISRDIEQAINKSKLSIALEKAEFLIAELKKAA